MSNSKHTVLLEEYKASLDGWTLIITFHPRQLAAGPTAPHLSLLTMIAHDSADARTALMASYFSRYPHPRAGKKPIASRSPLQRRNLNIPERLSPNPVVGACDATLSLDGDRLAMRGRTIYNANLAPSDAGSTRGDGLEGASQQFSLTVLERLQRIDAEEMKRKELLAMGCSACSSRYPTQEGVSLSDHDEATTGWQVREGDDRAAREMFDMYIRVEECMG